MQKQLTSCTNSSALVPGGTIVRFNEHDQKDGVPASPAQEGRPYDEWLKPQAVVPQQNGIGYDPGAHIDQLQSTNLLLHDVGTKTKFWPHTHAVVSRQSFFEFMACSATTFYT